MPLRLAFLALVTCLTCAADAPRVLWSYEASSNLYAPPLVVDVHPRAGRETIISDSEVRMLRCVDAAGQPLWAFKGGWVKRLTSSAALSTTARPGKGTLLIAGSDGKLCCLDAENGTLLWDKQVGPVTWGTALWADLDGDGRDEAVAATEQNGVQALTANGHALWQTKERGGHALALVCPAAAADVDGDGVCEIVVVDTWGPLCLDGKGNIVWSATPGPEFLSAALLCDLNRDGSPELCCEAIEPPAAHCFDATNGALRWTFAMAGKPDAYTGSAMAAGDLDGDGWRELVACDASGHVYCLTMEGLQAWCFETRKRTHAAASLGDVDGDGQVEILVASGDHNLYCLDHRGAEEWRYTADLRLISPPTVTDVNEDGKTDLLFGGSDRTLRCLTLDAPYDPGLIPWPSRQFDAAQSGSSFVRDTKPERTVEATRSLLRNGGFEQSLAKGRPEDFPEGLYERRASQPAGWAVEGGGIDGFALDRGMTHSGDASLWMRQAVSAVTSPVDVSHELREASGSVFIHGSTASVTAVLRWCGAAGVLWEDALAAAEESSTDGWTKLVVTGVRPPYAARSLQLALRNTGPEEVWWDDAEVAGVFEERLAARAMVNQVGYETGAPKRFTAQSNFLAEKAFFEVLDESGRAVFTGDLAPAGRVQGAYGHDWGFHYWRGDFTAFDTPGTYRVRVSMDEAVHTSWPFEVGEDVLWAHTSRPAYRFFYYQRCGMAIPGFHGVCHRDDAVGVDGTQYELWGGWHDAGDYNTYHNAPYVWGLVRAYGVQKARFDIQDEDGNGLSDFIDEILWGGDHSRRMIAPDGSAFGGITSGYGFWGPPELETDNIPNTGDERPFDHAPDTGRDSAYHTAAAARIARFVAHPAPYVEAAKRGLAWAEANGKRGPLQVSAALDLLALTGEGHYAALAREWFLSVPMEHVDVVRRYDAAFGEDHTEDIRAALTAKAESMLALSANPFGVYTFGTPGKPNFFNTPAGGDGWHVGNSSHVMNAASAMALAYQFDPDPRYLAFVYDQFNWIMGTNPYDLCLMEGLGSVNPPTYHHRYTFAGVPRGAVPGSVVNGITYRTAGDDRPYFDMRGLDIPDFQPNEVWLPHNTAYLNALANLMNARLP